MPGKNRPRLVAKTSSSTKLYIDDLREVASLVRDESRNRSDILRDLVHEALRARRMRTIGRDLAEIEPREPQQQRMVRSIELLVGELAKLGEVVAVRMQEKTIEPLIDESGISADVMQRAMPALLRRVVLTGNISKVLMTIGMQKDGLSADEIKRQLALQDEAAGRQARDLIQRIASGKIAGDSDESLQHLSI